MRMLRITHLREGSGLRNDRAIADSMELLERGMVPGSVKSRKLEELWNTSQSTVSRRLTAVNALGLVSVVAKGWRYRLALGPELCRQHQRADDALDPWEPVT